MMVFVHEALCAYAWGPCVEVGLEMFFAGPGLCGRKGCRMFTLLELPSLQAP